MSEPVIAQKKPYVVELEAGRTYWWCVCGHSSKQPFCDGAHARENTGLAPEKLVCEETKRFALCGCKGTGSPPLCDGTHARL